MTDVLLGDDGVHRCAWCARDSQYVRYHDTEWGMPIDDDIRLFEKICLEGFQSGLSWLTILRKRESFREAFDGFDPDRVRQFDSIKVDQLVGNAGIIRHRGKIRSTIQNATRAMETAAEFGSLAKFLWSFEPKRHRSPKVHSDIPAITHESTQLSKSLKKRGWTFVGPTTCYAMMQAMGIVNDHLVTCDRWAIVEAARDSFTRP